MSYTLHITNKNYSSWSLRPWVLMRARGIAFGEVLHPFTPGSAPYFREISPAGKVPWLVDGDTVVWDSLAITEYLAEDFRDPPHEEELALIGTVTVDLRTPAR